MNKKRLQSYLSTGVIIGFLIDFLFILIIGVSEKKLNNFIFNSICSLIPTFITLLLINIELYKYKRVNTKKIIISMIISTIISFILGFIIEFIIIEVFNVKVWDIERILSSIYKSLIGVVIGINISYISSMMLIKNN